MKKFIILAIYFMFTGCAFAQTSLNPKILSAFNFSSTFIDKDYFKNNFIRGWNWGWSDAKTKALDKALHINSYHSFTYWAGDMFQENFNSNFCTQTSLENTSGSRKVIYKTTGLGIYLESALTVEPSSTFVPNVEADQGAVFGFLNKSSSKENVLLVILSGTQSFSDRFLMF